MKIHKHSARLLFLFVATVVITAIAPSVNAAVTDGLIFYAPFSDTSADDVSGGKTGNLGGAPEFLTAGIIGPYVRLTNDATLPETHVYWDDPTPEFDSFTVLSKLAEASHSPSGLNASALTGSPRWAGTVRSSIPVRGSQSFRSSRKAPVARRPSRLNATGIMWVMCPGKR